MKKARLALLAITLLMMACDGKTKMESATDSETEDTVVAYEVAKNYFFRNDVDLLPSTPKITSREDFDKLFGMAAVMGKDGIPTEIDFDRQFVLAVVLPITDISTEIVPGTIIAHGDTLFYSYEVKTGEKQTFSMQPVSIIILDKKYADKVVVIR